VSHVLNWSGASQSWAGGGIEFFAILAVKTFFVSRGLLWSYPTVSEAVEAVSGVFELIPSGPLFNFWRESA
jgi:hypothetical protein